MPARDKVHEVVRTALLKDGWTITNDPLFIRYAGDEGYIDLAAEKLLTAERENQKIAVEIKTFAGRSSMHELHNAIGQYLVYRSMLKRVEPGRVLFLALPVSVWIDTFQDGIGAMVVRDSETNVLLFSTETEEIIQWNP
jgi:hypothetical protein